MAVVNTKSDLITNSDATPRVLNSSQRMRSFLHDDSAEVEVAAADDDTSTYRFVRLPTNCIVRAILVYNDAITGGTSYDFGIYYTADSAKAGVVVPNCAALFGSAIDLSSAHASTGPLDVTYEATATNIDVTADKELWDLAGLTSDPGGYFDVVATANTVGSAAGSIRVRAVYCVRGN